MNRKFWSVPLLFFLGFGLLSGCSGGGKPSGFPRVYPCVVKVTRSGVPVAEVKISLVPEATTPGNISFFGATDEAGSGTMRTSLSSHFEEGVPVGDYKVLLAKEPTLAHTKAQADLDAMDPDTQARYYEEHQKKVDALPKVIPLSLTKSDLTPLKLSVTSAGGSLNVELDDHKK